MVLIQSSVLTVQLEELGAQLASIQDEAGREYLWQGDPDIWARRAPILFPIVGRLQSGRYALNHREYTIPTHGFARDMLFTVTHRGGDFVCLTLSDNEGTRPSFPFAFTLTVTYRLVGHVLHKTHLVQNRSDCTMYYELGGHDGFAVPFAPGETMADCAVRLPGLSILHPYAMDQRAMLLPKAGQWPLEEGRVSLTPATYGLDTVIVDELPQPTAQLLDGEGRVRVEMTFPNFPYFGIWTAPRSYDTGYVCLEPWTTLPDGIFVGRNLSEKAGIRALPPGGRELLTYSTAFFP